MSAEINDQRSDEQKKTHWLAVVAKDKFMSGWGRATHGASRCAWAFNPSEVNSDRVFNWVKGRSEMRYVNVVDLRTYRAPRGTAQAATQRARSLLRITSAVVRDKVTGKRYSVAKAEALLRSQKGEGK